MYKIFLYFCFFPSMLLHAQDLLLQIDAHNDVDFIFIDQFGRKTGIDSRFSSSDSVWKIYKQIPNANYDLMEIPDVRPNMTPTRYRELLYGYQAPNNDGNYLIQVNGTKLCAFNLYIDISLGSLPSRHENIKTKGVPLDKDSVIVYQLIIDSHGQNLCKQKKLIGAQSLLQDVIAMSKLGWIKTEETANSYLMLFQTLKTQYDAQNYASARATLNIVIQNLVIDSTSAITIDAYKYLRSDIDQLLEQLPNEISVSVLLDTLHSRLQQSYTKYWIGDHAFVQILDKNIQNAKSKYAAKDSIGCAQEIEAFYKIIRLQYLATLKKQGKQFVTVEAYNQLYGFSKGIIEKVLILPPRTNTSLIDQITVLGAQIRIDANQGLLGGELLLKGLEYSLDQAKLKLQKPDSVGAALYTTLFQQTVRQVYEITKNYPASKLFVKAGGYISLYYRAEYILERLTAPIGQPMPKIDSVLEKELKKYEMKAVE
jgi:hypothetical protein